MQLKNKTSWVIRKSSIDAIFFIAGLSTSLTLPERDKFVFRRRSRKSGQEPPMLRVTQSSVSVASTPIWHSTKNRIRFRNKKCCFSSPSINFWMSFCSICLASVSVWWLVTEYVFFLLEVICLSLEAQRRISWMRTLPSSAFSFWTRFKRSKFLQLSVNLP